MPDTSSRQSPAQPESADTLTTCALFAFVVVAWGLNWVVMKVVVQEMPPLWAVASRTAIAAAILAPILYATGNFIWPDRSDYPIILVIGLFHMVGFSALMTAGLKYVPAGRAIVLGYTTPLWVAPMAALFLKESLPIRRLLGISIGMAGLLYLFGPKSFDWKSTNDVVGNGLIVLAAVSWSVSIVYTRAHRWAGTPFQLVLWQTLLAAIVLSGFALYFEGLPHVSLSGAAVVSLLYNGAIGTALGFWAMTVVNRRVPATAASLGVLATPIVGIVFSILILGEAFDTTLVVSATLIIVGVVIGVSANAVSVRRRQITADGHDTASRRTLDDASAR